MTDQEVIDAADVVELPDEGDGVPLPAATPPSHSTALVARDEIDVSELVQQSAVIEQAMKLAMKEGVHYGKIPGVNKPTLLKPGTEKLQVLFRLAPSYETQMTWHDDGHLTVMSICTHTHIPTGLVIASGEGLCTTRESRYAWRKGERLCPECGKATVREGKARNGRPGNWYCWNKPGVSDGCGATWELDSEQGALFKAMTTERVANPDLPDTYNCVTPETRVLTRDLNWVPAGNLATGDVLIGVNEDLPNKNGRRYEESTAIVGDRFVDDVYEIRADDGRVVRCNGEHRWLVKSIGSGVEWVSTETIHEDLLKQKTGRPRKWRIMTIGAPWETEDSYDAGYIAGLLDADGCLGMSKTRYHSVVVQFAQQAGGVLSRFVSGLGERAFGHRMYPHGNKVMRKPVYTVALSGGLLEQMRLLGTIRPPRLIERWDTVELAQRRFEGRDVLVDSISHLGKGELVRLGTSSHTYIAEGMVCHNTVLKMANKRAQSASILSGTAASDVFTQDMEDAPRGGGSSSDESAIADSQEPVKFDPATVYRDDAPRNGWTGINDVLMEIDPSIEWGPIIRQAISSIYGGDGDRKKLGENEKPAGIRTANAVGLLSKLFTEETFLSVQSIQRAFAEMFEGVVVDVPTGDEALAEANADLDAERNQDVTREIG